MSNQHESFVTRIKNRITRVDGLSNNGVMPETQINRNFERLGNGTLKLIHLLSGNQDPENMDQVSSRAANIKRGRGVTIFAGVAVSFAAAAVFIAEMEADKGLPVTTITDEETENSVTERSPVDTVSP